MGGRIMPRKRRKKTTKKKEEKKPQPKKKTSGEEQLEVLEAIAYSAYTNFIKTIDDIIVVVYEVPTNELTGEDQIRNWRLGLEAALVQAANKRRLVITRDKFHLKALPQGEMTLIKGYFKMEDVIGGAGKEQHTRQRPPRGREGLIIEE